METLSATLGHANHYTTSVRFIVIYSILIGV